MKRAMVIGAGNIGRGFIGERLFQGGYEIVFADVNLAIIDEINRIGGYTVHIMDIEQDKVPISNISGVNSISSDFVKAFCSCSLITTAVGPTVLNRIAPAIASGINARRLSGCTTPFNVIACENAIHASSYLKKAIAACLDQADLDYLSRYGGFPNCVVDRIVPPASLDSVIDVAVEQYFEWDVDKSGICGPLPQVPGMTLVDQLDAYLERKLFTLNLGHAVCAYLGYRKGIRTIDAAIKNPAILKIVSGAMMESGEVLLRKFSFNSNKQIIYIKSILNRFRNPYLNDDVARVGREPIRKLSSGDRLIKPITVAISYGLETPHLITGIAAALHYKNPSDAQSCKMQKMIEQYGVKGTLNRLNGMDINSDTANKIEKVYSLI